MDYTKMNNEQLENELESIGSQIDSLYNKQYAIQAILKTREEEAYKQTNDILNVCPGSYVMAIAKHQDYHYIMYELYYIIDTGNIGLHAIQYTYREDDGDYSFRITKSSIPNSHFYYLTNDHILLSINPTEAENIKRILTNLEVDYKNREEYNKLFLSKGLSRIEV